jgi:hypothetical protein
VTCPGDSCKAAERAQALGASMVRLLKRSGVKARIVLVVLSDECDCANSIVARDAADARHAAALAETAAKAFDSEDGERASPKPN